MGRWLLFRQEYEGAIYEGDFNTLELASKAIKGTYYNDDTYTIYGIVDETLVIYHSDVDIDYFGKYRGYHITFLWLDENDNLVQVIRDEDVFDYDVPIPEGYVIEYYPDGAQLRKYNKMPLSGTAFLWRVE